MQKCHYCPKPGDTKEHIVPKLYLRGMTIPAWLRSRNIVRACHSCNHRKKHYRSNCTCTLCVELWNLLGPLDKNGKPLKIPVIDLVCVMEEVK